MSGHENDEEIARIRARLASLEAERAALEVTLGELERQRVSLVRTHDHPALVPNPPSVTAASSTIDKVALFRRLFAGRPDVFPVRWDTERRAGRAMPLPVPTNG